MARPKRQTPVVLTQISLPEYIDKSLQKCSMDESKKAGKEIKKNDLILSAIISYLTYHKGYKLEDFE
jgi:hypothetical protein